MTDQARLAAALSEGEGGRQRLAAEGRSLEEHAEERRRE
jgi:hypothetical protein